jgi:hypothetical protein
VVLIIDIRRALKMLRRLGATKPAERDAAVAETLKTPSEQMPPVLYALANVLSKEPGRTEDALFWYHVGRLRAVFDALRCRGKTARKAVTILGRNLSEELRSAQRDNPPRALAVAKRAIKWDSTNPRDYDHRWVTLPGFTGQTAPLADAAPRTYPETEWPDILRYVHETHLRSVQIFAGDKKGR